MPRCRSLPWFVHAATALACVLALGGTAASATAPTASPGQVAAAETPGRIVERIATQLDATQQYSLYLPPGYRTDRRWPVLIVLDPRGRAEATLAMARPGAEANGWIVMSSFQSRSDDLESITLTALQALLGEMASYPYDPRRVYLAGMSGTAKTLWTVQGALQGGVAGYIGAGGGRPPEFGKMVSTPPAFYGIAGDADFNYQQMRELDALLARQGTPHRLAIFHGEHGWPLEIDDFTAAIDWLELVAMREARTPRREPWIDVSWSRAQTDIDAAPDALERWRRVDQRARDFDGLRDVTADRDAADRLRASPEFKQLSDREERLRAEERRQAKRLDAWIDRFNQRMVEGRKQSPPSLSASLADLRIRAIQTQAQSPETAIADSARRKLALVYAAGIGYLPQAQLRLGDVPRARLALTLAQTVYPDRAPSYCRLAQLDARGGDLAAAFSSLQACLDRGYRNRADLDSNEAWAPMRADPRWRLLVGALGDG